MKFGADIGRSTSLL